VTQDLDSPLVDISADTLGRSAYARRVAKMIAGWRGEHSAVFAIYGEWGSGKTSFKNFVVSHFDQQSDRAPIIIDFNPWEWEGPSQVAQAFFARIAEEIGTKGARGAEVSERLSRYGAYFTLGASIAESAGVILPFFLPGSGPIASMLQKAFKGAGEQAKVASEAKPTKQTLSELRASLVEAIRNLDRTIVVTIDDVDRLTTSETALLFQLLKSNADFPNVVYLVLCDREVVAQSLGRVVAECGDEYLEKIIQVGLPLPKAYPEQLRTVFFDGIESAVATAGVEHLFDRNRLLNLYEHHATTFFRTMRDVKRFLASFNALLPAVAENGDAEVDVIDFIGMEILRTFDHVFYERIYCYRDRITGREGVLSEDKDFLETLGANAEPASLDLFGELFPRFGKAQTLLTRPRGASDPRAFDRYFLFGVPPDQYSAAEQRDVLLRRTTRFFLDDLQHARERRRLQHLLEVLGRTAPPNDPYDAAQYMSVLAEFADSMHVSDGAADNIRPYRAQIELLIFNCLSGFDIADQSDLLLRVLEGSSALWFAVDVARLFQSNEQQCPCPPEVKVRLRNLALSRLTCDRIERHPAAGELLLWWSENGDHDAAVACARSMLQRETTLLNLLHSFSQDDLALSGNARKLRGEMRALSRQLDRLVPINEVLARIDELDEAWLTARQRDVVRAVRIDARKMKATDRE